MMPFVVGRKEIPYLQQHDQADLVRNYFSATQDIFRRWGGNTMAIHYGYYPNPDSPADHLASLNSLTNRVVQEAGIKSGDVVLENGCGFGGVSKEVAKLGTSVYAVDFSSSQIGMAKQGQELDAQIRFSLQDFTRLAIRDNFIDHVIFIESLAHTADKLGAISEAKRVLKRGGNIVITDCCTHNLKNDKLLEIFESGWKAKIIPIGDMESIFKHLELKLEVTDITGHVLPSIKLAALSAEEHPDTEEVSDTIKGHRAAAIAFRDMVMAKKIYYFLLTATKE